MARTLFHGNHISLIKWFWVIYFLFSDIISEFRLSKFIAINWRTARLILRKIRATISHRNSRLLGIYLLLTLILLFQIKVTFTLK
jgi:hypothetical protein